MGEQTKTSVILGCFLVNEGLNPENLGINKSFFKNTNERIVFSNLNENRDIAIMADKIGGKIRNCQTYLMELMGGIHKSGAAADRVRLLINEVRKERLQENVLKVINEGAKHGQFDHKTIKQKYMEIASIDSHKTHLLNFGNIETREIDWLVPDVFARGIVHAVCGVQGHGKSMLLYDLAAKISTGSMWGLAEKAYPAGNVLYVTDEDSREQVIKPRLQAAGADTPKISIPDFNIENLALPEDEGKLRSWIRAIGDCPLAILDPLLDFSTGNLNEAKIAVPILRCLKRIAEEENIAIIYVVHFRKTATDFDIQRVAHSYILTSKPRLVWYVVKSDLEDEEKPERIFCSGKSTFRPIPNMLFDIQANEKDVPIVTNWRYTKTKTSEAMSTGEHRRDIKTQKAEEFLMSILDGQTLYINDLIEIAKKENIARRTLYLARNNICVESDTDEHGKTFWKLCKK